MIGDLWLVCFAASLIAQQRRQCVSVARAFGKQASVSSAAEDLRPGTESCCGCWGPRLCRDTEPLCARSTCASIKNVLFHINPSQNSNHKQAKSQGLFFPFVTLIMLLPKIWIFNVFVPRGLLLLLFFFFTRYTFALPLKQSKQVFFRIIKLLKTHFYDNCYWLIVQTPIVKNLPSSKSHYLNH